jgi:pimeloyl-ACP methyl ester carboxylesterase
MHHFTQHQHQHRQGKTAHYTLSTMSRISSFLPTILCLHGTGTSGSIFEAQTRNLRSALKSQFKFIFIDAPYPSLPGPGVLPAYVDSGPFYSWFSPSANDSLESVAREFGNCNEHIKNSLAKLDIEPSSITAVMGFSQGTIVASMLLGQAQYHSVEWASTDVDLADVPWAGLRFGVLLSGSCSDGVVTAFMGKKLQLPCVHLHGLQDPFLEHARMLHTKIYHATSSDVVEFDGGHNIPGSKADLDRLVALIRGLNRKTKTKAWMKRR